MRKGTTWIFIFLAKNHCRKGEKETGHNLKVVKKRCYHVSSHSYPTFRSKYDFEKLYVLRPKRYLHLRFTQT